MKILAIEDSKLRNGYLHLVVYRNDTRLGVLKYQPQSTRGAEHEVTSFLADNGYIAKKYLTGYSMPKNLNIRIPSLPRLPC